MKVRREQGLCFYIPYFDPILRWECRQLAIEGAYYHQAEKRYYCLWFCVHSLQTMSSFGGLVGCCACKSSGIMLPHFGKFKFTNTFKTSQRCQRSCCNTIGTYYQIMLFLPLRAMHSKRSSATGLRKDNSVLRHSTLRWCRRRHISGSWLFTDTSTNK